MAYSHPVSRYYAGFHHIVAHTGNNTVLIRKRPTVASLVAFSDGTNEKLIAENTINEQAGFDIDDDTGAFFVLVRRNDGLYEYRSAYFGNRWTKDGVKISGTEEYSHPVSKYYCGFHHVLVHDGNNTVLIRFKPGEPDLIAFSDGTTVKVVATGTANERAAFEVDDLTGAFVAVVRRGDKLYEYRAPYPGCDWTENGIEIKTEG